MSRATRWRSLGLFTAAVAIAVSGCADGDASDRVTVAAAADLRYALDDVIALAQQAEPGADYVVTYGSSGQFLQQISNGAPFDIFLSADLNYPQQLVTAGKASEPFAYAVGRLVLWVPEGSSIDPTVGWAALEQVSRLAIANPEHAPYGRAAVAAMTAAGVYDAVEERIVLGENVAQAAEFVTSGNADAGVVALSLVLSDPLRGKGAWWEIPLASYPTIEQGGALIRTTPGARALRDAMLSAQGRAVLARYGFTLPED